MRAVAFGRGAATLALLTLAATAAASGDWLVLADGSRVETRGAWQERGAMLVFTAKNGTLSSLRRADVDLDASAAATAAAVEAARPKEPAPPVKREPVAVLTEADLPPVGAAPIAALVEAAAAGAPTAAGGTPAGGTAPPAGQPPAATPQRLVVADWQENTDDDQPGTVTLVGNVLNSSPQVAGQIKLTVTLLDGDGKPIADGEALLGASLLQPGQRAGFRVVFPGVSVFANVRFAFQHFAIEAQTPPAPATGP